MSAKPKTVRECADQALAISLGRLLKDLVAARRAGRKLRARVDAYPGIGPTEILEAAQWMHEYDPDSHQFGAK